MRTKALVLAAAATAVAVGSVMADPVYSVNVVGFVNKSLAPGWSIIENPLNTTNNYVSTVLANVPDNTLVFAWDAVRHTYVGPATYYAWMPGWDLPGGNDIAINPGSGFWIYIDPTTVGTAMTTVTFVGEVMQGTLNNPIATGYNLVGSQVPQQAALSTLGFVAGDSDYVWKWVNTGVGKPHYDGPYNYYAWLPGWDPSEPSLDVGEGIWIYRDSGNGATSWTRTFNVQ